jgi:hypothetical protein
VAKRSLLGTGGIASVALAASGIGIALQPQRAVEVLGLRAVSPRGIAETRAGLGGTFAALGLWALATGSADAYTAVGVTWLGAAASRTLSLGVDKPETDATYWAYLIAELTFGVGGLLARSRTPRTATRQ